MSHIVTPTLWFHIRLWTISFIEHVRIFHICSSKPTRKAFVYTFIYNLCTNVVKMLGSETWWGTSLLYSEQTLTCTIYRKSLRESFTALLQPVGMLIKDFTLLNNWNFNWDKLWTKRKHCVINKTMVRTNTIKWIIIIIEVPEKAFHVWATPEHDSEKEENCTSAALLNLKSSHSDFSILPSFDEFSFVLRCGVFSELELICPASVVLVTECFSR